MTITSKSTFAQFRRNWSSRLRATAIDRRNRQQYGSSAPLFAERLWIPLSKTERALKLWKRRESGRVVSEWPEARIQLCRELGTVECCLRHWCDGVPWEDTGIYDRMLRAIAMHGKVDGLRTREDVVMRYQKLDSLFFQVKEAGGLSPRSSLVLGNFREEGGILFHIGPEGEPFFGGKGHHRLAIALALKLRYLPAKLGCIHTDGLRYLPALRKEPEL